MMFFLVRKDLSFDIITPLIIVLSLSYTAGSLIILPPFALFVYGQSDDLQVQTRIISYNPTILSKMRQSRVLIWQE